jgi:ribosomal protein L37AE/L43A
MLLCPNCSEKLTKDPKHGEGVWKCTHEMCGMVWFILDIPQKYKPQQKKEPQITKGGK